MKKESSRRSNLLLMEIILSVLFFAVAGTVCLQVFVRASLLAREARELDSAVRSVSSAAELLSHPDYTPDRIMDLYPDARIEESDIFIWYDQDFQSCQEEDASYQMKIQSASQDTHTTVWSAALYDMSMEEIYSLEGMTYQQQTLSYGHEQ